VKRLWRKKNEKLLMMDAIWSFVVDGLKRGVVEVDATCDLQGEPYGRSDV